MNSPAGEAVPVRAAIRYLVYAIAAISMTIGGVVFVGWHIHSPALVQIHPSFVPMQYNTALGFVFSGAALFALMRSRLRAAALFSLAPLLIGGLTSFEYILGVNLGIDELFMDHYILVKTSHPGRMAPNTALCFSLAGGAGLIASSRPAHPKSPAICSALGAVIFGLGFVAFTGYFIEREEAYGWGGLTRMAIHTAFTFIILGVGFVSLSWEREKDKADGLPYWLPFPVGIGGVTAALAMWRALRVHENRLVALMGPESSNYADEGILLLGVMLSVSLALSIRFIQKSLLETRAAMRAGSMYIQELEERKRALEKLIESETVTRTITETATDAIIQIDNGGGEVVYWNPAAEAMFGYSSREAMGKQMSRLIIPERMRADHDKAFAIFRQTGKGKLIGKTIEISAMRKDGTEFPVELSLASAMIEGHWHAIGIIRDIAERKRIENELRDRNELFGRLFSTTHVMLAYMDPGFNFIKVNPAYARASGKTADYFTGKNHFTLYPLEENEVIFRRVVETGQPYTAHEKVFAHPDQPERGMTYWDWTLEPVKDSAGSVVGLLLSLQDVTERVMADRTVKESEERFRTFADLTYDWEYWVAPDGRFVYVSPSCERISGYSADEFMKDPELLMKIVHPEDRAALIEHHKTGGHESGKHTIDFRITRRDGEVRWMSHSCQPAFDKDGKSLGRRGSNRDVTDRKTAEDALKESEERWRGLVETTNDLVWEVDENAAYTYISPQIYDILGYRPEEVLGKPPFDLMPPGEAKRVMDIFEPIVTARKPFFLLTNVNIHKDGREIVLETSGTPFFKPDGSFGGYRGIDRDISERKKAEDALQESEKKFKAIFDCATDGILVADIDEKRFYMANRTICDMLGSGFDEITKMGVMDIHPKDDLPYVIDQFEKQAKGEIVLAKDIPVKRKDGSVFFADVNSAAVTIGGRRYLMGMFRDITERKKMEEDLHAANTELQKAFDDLKKTQNMLVRSEKLASLGALSAGVAHEIKNPLNIISAGVQLLMMEENVPEESMETYKTIIQQINRAVKITDNLRDFARERKPEIQDVDLHAFLEKTIALVEYEMKGESIEIVRQFEGRPIQIKGDPDQLAQVFLNVISNARDSMNAKKSIYGYEKLEKMGWKGKLLVQTKAVDGWVEISFTDTGVGMSQEEINKVFDPFFTTKEEKGTGLGMAIAFGIISNHGGSMDVGSEKGEWAKFTIRLSVSG